MAHDIRVVTEAELRKAVSLNTKTVDVVERAFTALADGDVIMPPIMSMDLAGLNAEVDSKTAFIPGFGGFAVKTSTAFYGNAALGMPTMGGLMVLYSATTGAVMAVFLDNGYLTDLRTAAAGAVAARHLAPKVVKTAGVMGTGVQARLQIEAAYQERKFDRVLVWGRNADKAQACAKDLAERLGIEVKTVSNPAKLVLNSQLVITTTPSREPLIKPDWLHSGLHITAMGSDAEAKNEIDPMALIKADRYVVDNHSQCAALGELRSALAAGVWNDRQVVELGDVILGRVGRRADNDITICDLTGTGAQDTAIATYVYDMLKDGNVGTVVAS